MNILVYDSGVGGRSVFHLLEEYFQTHERHDIQLHYFADTANYPYGTKTEEQLTNIVLGNIDRFLKEGNDLVVVACNTASSVIEHHPEKKYEQVITIIQPTVEAVKKESAESIYVIASQFTANNHVYSTALSLSEVNKKVTESAEQTLINAIEADDQQLIAAELSKIISKLPSESVFLWGCTHFSLIKDRIQQEMETQGKLNQVVDPAEELANTVIARV